MKRVTVQRQGGANSVPVELIEGETAEQIIQATISQLGLEPGKQYSLFHKDQQVTGDVYKLVKDDDTLTVVPHEFGGAGWFRQRRGH